MRVRQRDLGLALGGGSMLGISHIGVLEVLEENGIRPGIVTGTSAGVCCECWTVWRACRAIPGRTDGSPPGPRTPGSGGSCPHDG